VPKDEEWNSLVTSLGGATTAGLKMKNSSGWNSTTKGTNESGMNALPAGYRNSVGKFLNIGVDASWWSATESSQFSAWFRYLGYGANLDRINSKKDYGMSVRCIKD
jgi:uncharacterized protein (TIGR02145 family)